MCVLHDENHIKSTQDCSLEVDILPCTPGLVVPPEYRVSSCENGRPRVKDSRNASLGNRDSLLFHSFMNSNTVFIAHLVKLVDADDSTICEYHSPSF